MEIIKITCITCSQQEIAFPTLSVNERLNECADQVPSHTNLNFFIFNRVFTVYDFAVKGPLSYPASNQDKHFSRIKFRHFNIRGIAKHSLTWKATKVATVSSRKTATIGNSRA